MLEIDEVGAGIPGNPGGRDVIEDELFDFRVGKDLLVRGHMEFAIKERMTISHTWFQALFVIRFAESAGMRELKTDDQIVGAAMVLPVGLEQDFAKSGKIGFVLVGNNKLIRVRPAIRAHGHGLSAVN